MGGVEDELGRAVVLLELDDRRVGVVALEVEDVADVGAAPAVDRLVVVADDRQVAVLRGQRPDPEVLRPVRVLVLVDVEVAPAILVAGEDVRRLVEQADRLEQEVVEVERADLLEPLDVALREPGDHLLVVVDGVLGEERRVEHLVLRAADRAEHGRRPELAGQRHVLLAEDRLHERLLVVGVVDDEAAADPDRLAVAPEDPGAERVERARLDVAARLADERDDPLAQLAGGPVRERHREDLPRPDALDADEVRDAVGEDARLAAAGAGEDEERAIGRRDGPRLLRIQVPDDLLGALRGGELACRLLLRFPRPSLVCASAPAASRPGRGASWSQSGSAAGAARRPPPRRRRRSPRSRGRRRPGCRRSAGGSRGSPGHCRSAAFTRPSRPGTKKPRAGGFAARGLSCAERRALRGDLVRGRGLDGDRDAVLELERHADGARSRAS